MNDHSAAKLDETIGSRANFENLAPEDPSHQEINIKEHRIIPLDSGRPTDQDNGSCKSKIRAKRWVIIAICVILLLTGLIVGLVVGLRKP